MLVRWDSLFDDLAGQFEAGRDAERAQEAIDDERLRIARLTLRERLLGFANALSNDERITLELASGERIEVEPVEFGADWFAAELAAPVAHARSCLIPLAGVSSLLLTQAQLERTLHPPTMRPTALSERIGFAMALRDLSRRREHVEITTERGQFHGTIDRVGRDHLDLAVHDALTPRRNRDVVRFRLVPLAQVQLVRVSS